MLRTEEVEEEETAEEEYTEDAVEEEAEEEVSISEIVAEELEKGVSPRFDKVDEDIARIYELVSGIVVEDEPEVEYEDFDGEPDYAKLSEVVATELEKVTARFDTVEESIAKISDLFNRGNGSHRGVGSG